MKDDTTKISRNNGCLCYRLARYWRRALCAALLLSPSVASLMLYEDYLDNRLCSSRLDYGRCCWRVHIGEIPASRSFSRLPVHLPTCLFKLPFSGI